MFINQLTVLVWAVWHKNYSCNWLFRSSGKVLFQCYLYTSVICSGANFSPVPSWIKVVETATYNFLKLIYKARLAAAIFVFNTWFSNFTLIALLMDFEIQQSKIDIEIKGFWKIQFWDIQVMYQNHSTTLWLYNYCIINPWCATAKSFFASLWLNIPLSRRKI
jgi:hypothetical protein